MVGDTGVPIECKPDVTTFAFVNFDLQEMLKFLNSLIHLDLGTGGEVRVICYLKTNTLARHRSGDEAR